MSQNETLKIKANTDNIVEFLYDTPKSGTNNYGAWHLYGVRNNGREVGIFATDYLHDKLQYYRKGDVVNIRKEEVDGGKIAWNVIPQEGTQAKNSKNTTLGIDDRTHDIHKQVCLKLAVDMVARKPEYAVLTDGEQVIIEANMKALLRILEGTPDTHTNKDEDNYPFQVKKALSTKLDKAWADKVKEYGMCEVCRKTKSLNAHHFYSRSIRVVRWDVDNGFCLCVGCHVFSSKFSAHKTPAEFVEWAIEKRGIQWYEDLKERKNSLIKYRDDDYKDLLQKIIERTFD